MVVKERLFHFQTKHKLANAAEEQDLLTLPIVVKTQHTSKTNADQQMLKLTRLVYTDTPISDTRRSVDKRQL